MKSEKVNDRYLLYTFYSCSVLSIKINLHSFTVSTTMHIVLLIPTVGSFKPCLKGVDTKKIVLIEIGVCLRLRRGGRGVLI